METIAIYYDLETTGLSFENDEIIEIAAYNSTLDKKFSTLINPQKNIPKEATKIHNITDEMVKDSPYIEGALQKFIDFCPKNKNVVLIAHNNDSFDVNFLKKAFQKSKNLEMPSWQFIDSLKWARKYRKDLPYHSLQYLREIYSIEKNQAHRALDDVITLKKVFEKMIDDLSFDVIIDLLKKNTLMPFGKHRGKKLKDVPKNYVRWLSENGAFKRLENKNLKEEFEKIGILI